MHYLAVSNIGISKHKFAKEALTDRWRRDRLFRNPLGIWYKLWLVPLPETVYYTVTEEGVPDVEGSKLLLEEFYKW